MTSMLRIGAPEALAATQLNVIERSELSVTVVFVAGGGGGLGGVIPGPSILNVSNCANPVFACRISWNSPTSIGALLAASGRVIVAAGTALHGSPALAFSKKRKFVEFTRSIRNQRSLARPPTMVVPPASIVRRAEAIPC